MALGVAPGTSWDQRTIQMAPSDTLILYSDGVIEAQNEGGDFFGEERLRGLVEVQAGCPVRHVRRELLRAVRAFAGETPQFDDITLMIVARET